jgi:hypothetical protein
LRQLQAFLKILKEGGLLGQKLKEVAHSSSAPWKPGENKDGSNVWVERQSLLCNAVTSNIKQL